MSHAQICPYCLNNPKRYTSLEHHINLRHPDVKGPYYCSICNKNFLKEETLKLHTQRMHALHLLADVALAEEQKNTLNQGGLNTIYEDASYKFKMRRSVKKPKAKRSAKKVKRSVKKVQRSVKKTKVQRSIKKTKAQRTAKK